MMLQCMKTILSYHEKTSDMILSDYNYMIVIPLIICFAELRWLLNSPAELIGMYNSLLNIAKDYDRFILVPLSQPPDYLKKLVETLLEHVDKLSAPLGERLREYLGSPNNVKAFGIMVKKFLNSLGFYLLNVDVCLYVWDQIILKIERLRDELFWALAVLLVCSEDELMGVAEGKFSDLMEMVWMKGKAVSKDLFVSKYLEVLDA